MIGDLNFLLVGVGGQGTLLAADLVALAGMAAGLDVTKSEVHGMAQRGGSVTSQVRWGRDVLSPLIAPADADYLLAFERLEAVRYAHWLRRGGVALINDYRLPPVSAAASTVRYPDEATEAAAFSLAAKRHLVPALALAEEAGNARTNNVVLVGSLAGCLPVDLDLWLGVISARVPASLAEVNIRAFQRGVRYAREGS